MERSVHYPGGKLNLKMIGASEDKAIFSVICA